MLKALLKKIPQLENLSADLQHTFENVVTSRPVTVKINSEKVQKTVHTFNPLMLQQNLEAREPLSLKRKPVKKPYGCKAGVYPSQTPLPYSGQ